jgi:hypothetical protein
MKEVKLIAIGIFTSVATLAQAQETHHEYATIDSTKKPPVSADGFKMNFKADGSSWAKINFTGQLWLTDNQNNPGSLVNGVSTANSYQVALRRARLSVSSQITDKVFLYANIASDGISSLTGGRSLPLQFIDLTAEYKLVGKYLSLGGGLTGWTGLSRYANPGIGTMLGADFPLYQAATNNITDNLGRTPGIYAKGKISKIDYRVSVNIPYPATSGIVNITPSATVSQQLTLILNLTLQDLQQIKSNHKYRVILNINSLKKSLMKLSIPGV